jgi:hypothetical protein
MSAKVTFLERASEAPKTAAPAAPVVTLPREAVATRDGKSVVFLVREGRARALPVQVGAERQGRVVIRQGLAGGEVVVANPPQDLKDGAAVRVKG